MIQEKDFLYRVPVKNALVTAPGKQVRNPEILVDLEGGEFMHGDILDANSINKLIDQSVKDAIDNSIENGNHVTKDLLEAEKSARIKSDEDLNNKIRAEQTRAEGKEKEISDKLAIVDGDHVTKDLLKAEKEDLNNKIRAEQTRAEGKEKEISDRLAIVDGNSNTEGSFRKAIADVIAAAPEDLDTLKEIADKLAGNDDLHTALNQAITEKADASALANEVTRATGVENDLRTAIDTKADATALSNYVLTTALNQQVDTLNAAISAKQDAGNYIPYDSSTISQYSISKNLWITDNNNEGVSIQSTNITGGNDDGAFYLDYSQLYFVDLQNIQEGQVIRTTYSINGITSDKYNNCLATSDGTFKPISDFASEGDVSSLRVGLSKKQNKITVNDVDVTDIETADITKLRTIVINLIDALSTSGLIRTNSNIE